MIMGIFLVFANTLSNFANKTKTKNLQIFTNQEQDSSSSLNIYRNG